MPEPAVLPGPDAPPPASTWRERLDLLAGGMPPSPARLATAAAVGLMAVVVLVLMLRGPAPPVELTLPVAGQPGDPALTTTTTVPSTTVADVVVHAAGALRSPGLYRLPAGARVAEVVEAAGGPLDDSDLDRLNLAAPVGDGQQVYVPRVGEAGHGTAAPGPVSGPPAAGSGPVDLNTATAEQLDTLPGVGPATAQAILGERQRRGRFGSVDELLDVRGIGEAKLDALRDLVTV